MSIYNDRIWLKSYDWKTPAEINVPKYPAYEILRNASNYKPDQPATWFYGAEINFGELYRKVTRLANVLAEAGIKKGDRVGILLPNSPQYVIAFWATLMAGGIVVNLNVLYTKDELGFIFSDTQPSALFTYDALLPLAKEMKREFNIPTIIATKLSDFMAGTPISTASELGLEDGWLHLSDVLASGEGKIWRPPVLELTKDDPAVIQYTGGTTGAPKGAVLTQHNIVAAAHTMGRWLSDCVDNHPFERRRTLSIIPFGHIYGEICCICYSCFNVGTMVILPRFDVNEVYNILHKFEYFQYWPAVPTMIQALFYSQRVDEIDWQAKIGYVSSGGAPASLELVNKCTSYDFRIFDGYGMTETSSLSISTPGRGPIKPLSVGIPYINTKVRLVNEDGNDVPLGHPGEIWIQSPTVMKGYWNRPEETEAAFTKDGWLKTGDVAYMDEDGYFFVVDRLKDMIIAGGYNIYPREVDDVLLKHPAVFDAITIGVPDEYRGETVKAFVQLKPGAKVSADELIAYSRDHLAAFKIPRIIEFRSELPRTPIGKALRRVLRQEEIAKMKNNNQ